MPAALEIDRVVLGMVPVGLVDLPGLFLGGRGGGEPVAQAYQCP